VGNRIWLYIGTICVAAVEVAVGVLISPTAAINMLIIAIPLGIISYWKVFKPNVRISLKKGGRKMLVGVGIAGIAICIGAIIWFGFLIKSQLDIDVKAATVYCCASANTYQIVVDNAGNDTETIFVTLGTSGLITDFKPLMGASLPNITEGGKNANFITFKVEQLPPNVSLSYLVSIAWKADQPHKFNAWSGTTKINIPVKFTGECPKIISVGPEEKAPR
jgi:hypothetical protein